MFWRLWVAKLFFVCSRVPRSQVEIAPKYTLLHSLSVGGELNIYIYFLTIKLLTDRVMVKIVENKTLRLRQGP